FRQNPDAWPALDDPLDALSLQHPAFPITRGHCVVEFHVSDVDKGKGLARAMQHPPFVGRPPVMIGDDVTDESAFGQADRADGLSLRVGDSLENSAASFLVPTPFNLLGLLNAWLSTADTTPLLREFARP